MAYLTLYPGAKKWAGLTRSAETLLNYAIIIFGFYILIAGTYVSPHFTHLFLSDWANGVP